MKETDKATLYKADALNELLVFRATYKRFQFTRHAHEDFALGVMNRGVQKFHYGGEEVYAPATSLITMNAGEFHDGRSADGTEYDYHIIYVPVGLVQKIAREVSGNKQTFHFSTPVTRDMKLSLLFSRVFSLLDQGATGSQLELHSLFYSGLSRLFEHHTREKEEALYLEKRLPKSIEQACDYINDMVKEPISLDEIAQVSGLSRYYFLRLFNSSMGLTPHSYLIQCRLTLAKDKIRAGLSLADIAYDTGFSDQSHLTRRFKQAFGITPKQFQRAVC